MLNAIKQRLDREDEGFTLIELMVVVLIIAILLAIAIPTFLGARNGANARSTQSNLRNALTAEQTQWTNTQAFDTTVADMSGVENALTWTTDATKLKSGDRQVATTGFDPATSGSNDYQVMELQGLSKDGNCYAILQSNDPTDSFTAYSATKASPAACAAPAAVTLPVTVTAGAAAAHTADGTWYTSF